MQTLIYENLRGQRVTFGASPPYVLCQLRGMGMSDVDITAGNGAYQQGESVLALRRKAREVKLTLHLLANTRADMYRLRAELCGVLSPERAFRAEGGAGGRATGKLIYENDGGRWWTWAVPQQGLDWGKRVQDIQPSVTLSFECESPYWFGAEKRMAVFQATRAGFTLPTAFPLHLGSRRFTLSAENIGHAGAALSIVMKGSGEMPTLRNETTGAVLKLVQQLPVGDVLSIRTDPASLRVSVRRAFTGAEENAYGLLSPESSVAEFVLAPGLNRMLYVPDSDQSRTEIRMEWYDCYEGV